MAEATPYSDYFFGLSQKMKERYCNKISCIGKEDPYTMKKTEFTKDMAQLVVHYHPNYLCIFRYYFHSLILVSMCQNFAYG